MEDIRKYVSENTEKVFKAIRAKLATLTPYKLSYGKINLTTDHNETIVTATNCMVFCDLQESLFNAIMFDISYSRMKSERQYVNFKINYKLDYTNSDNLLLTDSISYQEGTQSEKDRFDDCMKMTKTIFMRIEHKIKHITDLD